MSQVAEPLLSPGFLARLEQLELISRKIFLGQMKGERRSPRKGISVEFADYRNYVVGDDLRFIDWNIYGRLDRLFLKLFLEEEDLHVYLLVDTSESMEFGDPPKLRYASQVAAALGFIGLVKSDRVVIESVGGEHVQRMPPLRGRAQLWRMLDFLEHIEPDGGVPLAQGIKNFTLRHSGRGICVLLSDLMDKAGYEEALRYLLARNMDIYVIHLLSQEEIEPDFSGDLRLVDCEDDDVAEITVGPPILKRYKQNLEAFCSAVKEFCTRRGMIYLFTSNQIPFERLVLSYLRQRGLVK
jgi:uncharacterized protein (DUF58 family)